MSITLIGKRQYSTLDKVAEGDAWVGRCQQCDEEFAFSLLPGEEVYPIDPPSLCRECSWKVKKCPHCGDRFVQNYKGQPYCTRKCSKKRDLRDWREMAGREFSKRLDFSLLANPAKARQVLDWYQHHYCGDDDEVKGLWIVGPTGSAKSRICRHVQKRLMLGNSQTVWLSGNDFHTEIIKRFKFDEDEDGESDLGSVASFVDRVKEADVVFFDDLAKLRLSDRIALEFHGVLEARTTDWRPIIFTSTKNPAATLRQCLRDDYDDRGPELVRRITEHCVAVNFAP